MTITDTCTRKLLSPCRTSQIENIVKVWTLYEHMLNQLGIRARERYYNIFLSL